MFAATFAFAIAFGSFVEYWGHRLMHRGWFLHDVHMEHHSSGEAKGVVPEFLHYVLGTSVFLPWGFLISPTVGWAFVAGSLAYALFSAYGHQAQHDAPARVFWMRRMPVHWVHHRHGMTHANFGLAVDWWDRVFGTYRPVAWDRSEVERETGPVRWL